MNKPFTIVARTYRKTDYLKIINLLDLPIEINIIIVNFVSSDLKRIQDRVYIWTKHPHEDVLIQTFPSEDIDILVSYKKSLLQITNFGLPLTINIPSDNKTLNVMMCEILLPNTDNNYDMKTILILIKGLEHYFICRRLSVLISIKTMSYRKQLKLKKLNYYYCDKDTMFKLITHQT